jgi:hypothetical protein
VLCKFIAPTALKTEKIFRKSGQAPHYLTCLACPIAEDRTRHTINPISTTVWLRNTLYICDGFSAIRYSSLLFKIVNGNVTIPGFIKQYFPVLFKTDDGIKTI